MNYNQYNCMIWEHQNINFWQKNEYKRNTYICQGQAFVLLPIGHTFNMILTAASFHIIWVLYISICLFSFLKCFYE